MKQTFPLHFLQSLSSKFKNKASLLFLLNLLFLLHQSKANSGTAAHTTTDTSHSESSHEESEGLPPGYNFLDEIEGPLVEAFVPFEENNCMKCLNDHPDFAFCNSRNQSGFCCPIGSTYYSCIEDKDVYNECSYSAIIPNFVYDYCIVKSQKQCGEYGKDVVINSSKNISIETELLKWESGNACQWRITSDEKKVYVFWKTIVIEFEEIEGVEVKIFSGFQKSIEEVVSSAQVGQEYRYGLYNTTYIQAIPLHEHETTKFKMFMHIESNVQEQEDKRKDTLIISVTITFGGFIIAILILSGLIIKKKLELQKKNGKNKSKSSKIMTKSGKQDDKTHIKKEDDDQEQIDFDENQENNTLESPKNSSNSGEGGKHSGKKLKDTKQKETPGSPQKKTHGQQHHPTTNKGHK